MRLLSLLFLLVLLAPPRAWAGPPVCSEHRAGLVACVFGKLCACGFERGSAATGMQDGFRWDCGVLRPACGEAADVPASLDRYPYPLPPGLTLDNSETDIRMAAPGRDRDDRH